MRVAEKYRGSGRRPPPPRFDPPDFGAVRHCVCHSLLRRASIGVVLPILSAGVFFLASMSLPASRARRSGVRLNIWSNMSSRGSRSHPSSIAEGGLPVGGYLRVLTGKQRERRYRESVRYPRTQPLLGASTGADFGQYFGQKLVFAVWPSFGLFFFARWGALPLHTARRWPRQRGGGSQESRPLSVRLASSREGRVGGRRYLVDSRILCACRATTFFGF